MTAKDLAKKLNISYTSAVGLLSFLRETGAAIPYKIPKTEKGPGKPSTGHTFNITNLNAALGQLTDLTENAMPAVDEDTIPQD